MFASWIVGHSVLQRVKAGEKEWAGSGKVYIIGGGGGGYFLRGKMTQVNDRSLKLKDLFSVMVGCNKRTYMINF